MRTRLIAVLVALAAVAVFTTDAFAVYHPGMGRFLQRDPAGYHDGMNRYEYVRSSPARFVDPSGLEATSETLTGVKPVNSECVCGPDVTEWFMLELIFQAIKRDNDFKAAGAGLSGRAKDLLAFRYQAKYLMAYKWMNFDSEGCGTGPCKHTVMLDGVCIRKNQLGNIMFGYVAMRRPPRGWTAKDTIEHAYKAPAVSTYDPTHTYADQFGPYKGKQRADNLAAFGVGAFLGSKKATYNHVRNMGQLMSDKNSAILNIFSELYPGGKGKITQDTLTLIPTKTGGFNTRSCAPCMKDGKAVTWAKDSPTAMQALAALWNEYQKSRQGQKTTVGEELIRGGIGRPDMLGDAEFDEWLIKNHENYYGE